MDGTLPDLHQPRTLPGRIDVLGAAGPPWADCAEAARALGLGLVMRGLQRGDHVLLASTEVPDWLPFALGALGAGAVLVGPTGEDHAAQAGDRRCAVVFVGDAKRLERHPGRRANLLALVGQDRAAPRGVLPLPDLLTLGRAVHGLDTGMWRECLDGLRPTDHALQRDGETLDHHGCGDALERDLAAPGHLAAGLAALLTAGRKTG